MPTSASIVVVPQKLTQHVGPNNVACCWLHVVGQQCCVRLHGPLDQRQRIFTCRICNPFQEIQVLNIIECYKNNNFVGEIFEVDNFRFPLFLVIFYLQNSPTGAGINPQSTAPITGS